MDAGQIVPLARIAWPPGSGTPAPSIELTGPAGADGTLGARSSVVLDFGVEVFGGIRFRVARVSGGPNPTLRIRLGESVSEANVGPYFDREVAARSGSGVEFGGAAFRFARIDLVGPAAGVVVEIAGAEAVRHAPEPPRLGAFSSDDPTLDRAWEVGARTAGLCMQGLIWDGIKRGRTVWAGDLHPAARVIAAAFGPNPVVGASLDHLRDRTPTSDWMNEIPAYSLWWIIAQAEWYRYSGDLGYLGSQRDYLAGLLRTIAEGLDRRGAERFDGWRYLDWATTRDPDAIHAGTQGLTAWALAEARSISLALGDRWGAWRIGRTLRRVRSARPAATANEQARALLALGGMADAGATNREALAPDPLAGLTPFLGSVVLDARALAGDHAGALGLIRGYWGAMIDLGASTFWEDFDIAWAAGSARIDEIPAPGLRDIHAGLGRNVQRGLGLSLCHAWSSGPTAWLSRHVLGIEPIEPGCRAVRIRPVLGNLSRAEGAFPTPLGTIEVRHRRRPDGTVETLAQAPPSIRLVVDP